jgi:hypothetical protein
MIVAYREYYGISLRDWAAEIQCDHTMLVALENGRGINAMGFGKFLIWMLKR